MSSSGRNLFVLILLCLGLAGGYALGAYLFPPLENNRASLSCPLVMEDIIQSSKGNVYEIGEEEYIQPETYYLVKYSVTENEITSPAFASIPMQLRDEQIDVSLQEEAWEIFATLIPLEDRRMIAQYNTFTDGSENTLAAVDQTPDDLTKWIVEVDVADLEDKHALLFTLVHEYAHVLTLNDSQAAIDEEIYNDPANLELLENKAAACSNYFTGGGCSYADSYIHAFYNRFWSDINAEWQTIDALQYADDLNPYYDGLFNFYLTHQDQFVDDYATTHPAEDIAESFTYFVFSPKPTGNSIIDQKILFFYDYPELVKLRDHILNGSCSIFQ